MAKGAEVSVREVEEFMEEAGLKAPTCTLDLETGEVVCEVTEDQLASMKEKGVMPKRVVLDVVYEVKAAASQESEADREPAAKKG